MKRPWSITGVVALGLALAACGGSSSTSPSSFPDISGAWNYLKTQTDTQHGITCADTGVINIVQSDSTFGGTYQQSGLCHAPDTTVSDDTSGLLVSGRIQGTKLLFSAAACDYTGTMSSGSTPDSLTGTGTCSIVDQDTTYNFDVQWRAGH